MLSSRSIIGIVVWLAASLIPGTTRAAELSPRSILIISEAALGGSFYPAVISALRSKVNSENRHRVSIFVENLGLSQFDSPNYRTALKNFFTSKYREAPVDVIVALGRSALEFVLRERSDLWPNIPVVFTFVDQTEVKNLKIPSDVTGHTITVRFNDMLSIARAAVPALDRVVILGDRLETQVAYRHIRDEIPATTRDLEVIDLTGLPMRELRKRVAVLPDHAAIIYTAIYSDGEGTFYAPLDALDRIAEVANRPIVISVESLLGHGGIGGMITTTSALGDGAARLVRRILDGESASTIPIVEDAATPIFDWRQLQRWGVSESLLPAGSEIRFRPPTAWEQYRWQIIFLTAIFLAQTALIIGMLYEHRRRQIAEAKSLQQMNELAHLNRISTAGELSASIAHELRQPLTAIVNFGSAGLRWLGKQTPDVGEAQIVLRQMVDESYRAVQVIDEIRALFKKDSNHRETFDVNELILETLSLTEFKIKEAEILVRTDLAKTFPGLLVLADRIQLQQVIMNLIVNAIEAMSSTSIPSLVLRVSSTTDDDNHVVITVEDSGPGIDLENVDRVFDWFFTTKPNGMGMGLSICRSIIEAHEGRLWATPGMIQGCAFHVCLPGIG